MLQIFLSFFLLFVFLFSFYSLSKEDFYFIRKGITLDDLFNIVFIGIFWGIIASRVVFVLMHMNATSNLFFYLFTLSAFNASIPGFIIGTLLAIGVTSARRNILYWKMLDYVSIAFLSAFPWMILGISGNIYAFLLYLVLLFFFILVLLPNYRKSSLKEGSISLLFVIMFSLVSLLENIFILYNNNKLPEIEDYFYIFLFFISSLLLIRSQVKSTK